MNAIKFTLCLAILGGLANCGAGGAPIRPSAIVNVSVGSNGVTVKPQVSAKSGNVGVTIGG